MEIPNEIAYPAIAAIGGGILALWRRLELAVSGHSLRTRVLEDEVKGHRVRLHEYGNHLNSHQGQLADIERELTRVRDGLNGRWKKE